MADRIVVTNATLLDGRNVDIAVEGDRIVDVAPVGRLTDSAAIDAVGGLATRPLTDSHIHIDKTGTAQLGGGVPTSIQEAITAMGHIKREALADLDGVNERVLDSFRLLVAQGTRCVRALVDVDETWGLTGFEAAVAARDALRDIIEIRIEAFPQEGLTSNVADMLREAASRGADAIGAHTDIDADPIAAVRTAAEIAREADLPLQVHVDEPASPDSFKLPQVLEVAAGVRHLTLAHCLSLATLPDAEQDRWAVAIAEAGAEVLVAPSILCFGLPLAPVARLMDAGVTVTVGTDNLQDVFVPFGSGSILEAARMVALICGLTSDAHVRALVSGITAAAWAIQTGDAAELKPGTPATFIVLSGSDPRSVLFGQDEVRISMRQGVMEEN